MSEDQGYVKNRGLNHNGVKNSANMWRTIDGVIWGHFSSECGPDDLKAFRRAGIRARRFGEETFVHPDDEKAAVALEDARRASRAALSEERR